MACNGAEKLSSNTIIASLARSELAPKMVTRKDREK